MSDLMSDDTLRFNLPALPENVAFVRSAVGERAESYGLAPVLVGDLKTVVSEACANVVVHAYADAAKPGPLEVEMTKGAESVNVVVRDHGTGSGRSRKRRPQASSWAFW